MKENKMSRWYAILLLLPLFGSACVSPLSPEEYPTLAVAVDHLSKKKDKIAEASVGHEFEDILHGKNYLITARGDALKKIIIDVAGQFSDMTEESAVELGKQINANALVTVEILEFSTLPYWESVKTDKGQIKKIKRFQTTAKIQATAWDLEKGTRLWGGKYVDDCIHDNEKPDTNLLDDVARRVAHSCPPKPWWWYPWWPFFGWW